MCQYYLTLLDSLSLHLTFSTHRLHPGLLSGHGTMSLERLHSMLRMIAGNSSAGGSSSAGDVHFDMTLPQLRAYLQGLVDGGKIEYLEGVYALCQPSAR